MNFRTAVLKISALVYFSHKQTDVIGRAVCIFEANVKILIVILLRKFSLLSNETKPLRHLLVTCEL